MLYEKVSYQDNLPINITIGDIREYPLHYHQDTEIVLVLSGELNLTNGYCNYLLKEGDIFINSSHEVHRMYAADGSNTTAVIQINTHYFTQYFPSLSKACYRTYTTKGQNKKHDTLKEKILRILLAYMLRSGSYKSECTYMMIDVIKYLDKYFNLFAFEENMVINFESGNQITIDRISRIIGYIYEYHAEKITLDDLAEMEHLSTFYLSHIIKNCTGMSFRDFLCFARVEWSAIDLLETGKKISKVARDVGFSSTSYYRKYFEKWFGTDPETYRQQNMSLVLSDVNKPVIRAAQSNNALALIRSVLSSLSPLDAHVPQVTSLIEDVYAEKGSPALSLFNHRLEVEVTLDDFRILGYSIFALINDLHPARVSIMTPADAGEEENEATEEMFRLFLKAGLPAEKVSGDVFDSIQSFGYDSIAYPLFLVTRYSSMEDPWIKVRLRDPGSSGTLLKGCSAVLSSNGIKKPSYYACRLLSQIRGEIILRGKYHMVIRMMKAGRLHFAVIAYNYNDEIYALSSRLSNAFNTKAVLDNFKDEVELSVNLDLEQGMYAVTKYTLDSDTGVFGKLAGIGLPEHHTSFEIMPEIVFTEPHMDMYVEDVRAGFSMNFTLKGPGLQMAFISPHL